MTQPKRSQGDAGQSFEEPLSPRLAVPAVLEMNRRQLKNRVLLAYSVLFACTIVWGINAHVVTIATQTMAPSFFLFARFAVGTGALLLLLLTLGPLYQQREGPRSTFQIGDILLAIAAAVLLGVAYQLQLLGFTHGDALLTVFLSSTCVLWVPVIVWITSRGKERISRNNKVGVVLSCLASTLASNGWPPRAS